MTQQSFPEPVSSLPLADVPLEGVTARLLQGDNGEVVFVHFEKDTIVPEHTHGGQCEFTLDGEVDLTVDGETRTYRKGEHFSIPAGVPHSGFVHAGYKAIMVFEERDRYRAK